MRCFFSYSLSFKEKSLRAVLSMMSCGSLPLSGASREEEEGEGSSGGWDGEQRGGFFLQNLLFSQHFPEFAYPIIFQNWLLPTFSRICFPQNFPEFASPRIFQNLLPPEFSRICFSQHFPEFASTQNFPEFASTKNFPEFASRKICFHPEFSCFIK